MLMIEDWLLSLLYAAWLAASTMPLGLMLGSSCSPCCLKPCEEVSCLQLNSPSGATDPGTRHDPCATLGFPIYPSPPFPYPLKDFTRGGVAGFNCRWAWGQSYLTNLNEVKSSFFADISIPEGAVSNFFVTLSVGDSATGTNTSYQILANAMVTVENAEVWHFTPSDIISGPADFMGCGNISWSVQACNPLP